MLQIIKTTSFYLLVGCSLTGASYYLRSDFLCNFLLENLLTILITLLAINLATIGIVFSKLEEIAIKIEGKTGKRPTFQKTQEEVALSIKEQFIMILLTIIASIVCSSEYSSQYPILKYGSEIALNTILIWALYVLYDTSNAVFKVLNVSIQPPNK